LNFTYNI